MVWRGRVLFERGYGFTDVTHTTAVDPHTLFSLGTCHFIVRMKFERRAL